MPKSGFTGLTVSVSLKQRLSEAARASGFSSVPASLESLLAGTVVARRYMSLKRKAIQFYRDMVSTLNLSEKGQKNLS